jgi:hypothetical protein
MMTNAARNTWKNQAWEKIKKKMLVMLQYAEETDSNPRDKSFCRQIISQIRTAIQMSRARLKDLLDAWRFVYFTIRTPDRVEPIEDRFEEWREKCWSELKNSRRIASSSTFWEIRLEGGHRIRGNRTDEEELDEDWDLPTRQFSELIVEIWALIREPQLESVN